MKIINRPILNLTNEEKDLLKKACMLLTKIDQQDTNEDLANFIINHRTIGCFDDLAVLIYTIVDSAENE